MLPLLFHVALFWNQENLQSADFIIIDSGIGQRAQFENLSHKGPVWQNRIIIWFEFKYQGKKLLKINPEDIGVEYEAELANSRIPESIHCLNRFAKTKFHAHEMGEAVIFKSSNEKLRCSELIALLFNQQELLASRSREEIALHPNEIFFITLEIDHRHYLCGPYEPLLGKRKVTLYLGKNTFKEEFSIIGLDENKRIPEIKLSAPPKERLDNHFFKSSPDSLYLCADIPGFQYFRFDDLHVSYQSRWKLSFWYLIAFDSRGKIYVRNMEYQDAPNAWYRVDGGFEETLTNQGQWQYFEKIFITGKQTTTIAIDFRILETDLAELWVNDIKLEPLMNRNFQISQKP